jgi:hypothetical protein
MVQPVDVHLARRCLKLKGMDVGIKKEAGLVAGSRVELDETL